MPGIVGIISSRISDYKDLMKDMLRELVHETFYSYNQYIKDSRYFLDFLL